MPRTACGLRVVEELISYAAPWRVLLSLGSTSKAMNHRATNEVLRRLADAKDEEGLRRYDLEVIQEDQKVPAEEVDEKQGTSGTSGVSEADDDETSKVEDGEWWTAFVDPEEISSPAIFVPRKVGNTYQCEPASIGSQSPSG